MGYTVDRRSIDLLDLHNHILFGLDDGSPDLETSLTMLIHMAENNITDVIFTPHVMPGVYNNNRQTIDEAFAALLMRVKEEQLPLNIYCGAEVFIYPQAAELIASDNLSLNGGKYVLLETDFSGFPPDFNANVFHIAKKGYWPILAHPERYYPITFAPEAAEELIHHNLFLQVNAGSLLGEYGKKVQEAAWKLILLGYVHMIGSDCHCRSNGENLLLPAYHAIQDRFNTEVAELLCRINPQKVLKSEKIAAFSGNWHWQELSFWDRFLGKFKRK